MQKVLLALVVFGAFSFAQGQNAPNGDISQHGGKAETLQGDLPRALQRA